METLGADLQACFEQGAAARARRRRCTENPYRRDSEAWHEWRAGWHATLDLDEEDDPASDRLREQDDAAAPERSPAAWS